MDRPDPAKSVVTTGGEMNFYRILDKTFILLFVIFMICCSRIAIADEKPSPVSPAEIKSLPATQPETEPSTIITPSNKLSRNAIGCVLPLSGPYAVWGRKALDAILLSAKTFDRENKTLWEVFVEDSGGLPEKTQAAIAHLANDKNVMAIIAVTETAEASEAAREAQKWKVPLILITSKEGVTSAGEYVFQHFLIPTQQISALVQYAYNDLNCAIFSIMYPKDDYGEEMVKIFRREVINIGGKVEKAIPYNVKQTDFADEISKLTGRIVRSSKTKTNKNDNQETASVDFEALFIPDSYLRVKMITSQLNFYDVKGFKLLGTSLWHSPDLLKNGAEYLEDAVFTDSFFVNGFYPETVNFVDAYNTAYGRVPDNIEALSFDTAGIIFSILENKNVKTRQELASGLIKMENYNGATGNIYFDSNRVAQKTAFLLRVKDRKLEQVQ
jgi:branched-chain amino acid transport system substrate-binding protein